MRTRRRTAPRACAAIKRLGVRIAIDDFGTGYSSLAYLQRFPVDALKIDRSFIAGSPSNPEGETLIRTLVQLGKALSIETLAEGIEDRHELTLLQERTATAARATCSPARSRRSRPSASSASGRACAPTVVSTSPCAPRRGAEAPSAHGSRRRRARSRAAAGASERSG